MIHTDPKLPNGGGEPIQRKYSLDDKVNLEKAIIDELWYHLTLLEQKIDENAYTISQISEAIYTYRELISMHSPESYYIGDYVDEQEATTT